MKLKLQTLVLLLMLASNTVRAHVAIPVFDLKGEGQLRNIKTSFFADETKVSESVQGCRIYATLLKQNPIIDIEISVDCDAGPNQWPQMFTTKLQLQNSNQELFNNGKKIGSIDAQGAIHLVLDKNYQSDYFPFTFKCVGEFSHRASKLSVQTHHEITFTPIAEHSYSFSMESREAMTFKEKDRELCKQLPERKETFKEFQVVNLEAWNEAH